MKRRYFYDFFSKQALKLQNIHCLNHISVDFLPLPTQSLSANKPRFHISFRLFRYQITPSKSEIFTPGLQKS